jgi:hypothetical protein
MFHMTVSPTLKSGSLIITTEAEMKNPKTTSDYFVATIAEEHQGRALPTTPIKLMAQCPEALGRSVGDLLTRRFHIPKDDLVQRIPRLKMIIAELKNSYLVIRLEPPTDQRPETNNNPPRGRDFMLFHRGIRASINLPKPPPILRRRLPPPNATNHSET